MVLCHPWFEHAILALIFASSIALALDMPHLDPTGPFKGALEVADCVFAVLFLVEAFLKVSGCVRQWPCWTTQLVAENAVVENGAACKLHLCLCSCPICSRVKQC
jgi:hypothetical protein